jgi:hypothetical protein
VNITVVGVPLRLNLGRPRRRSRPWRPACAPRTLSPCAAARLSAPAPAASECRPSPTPSSVANRRAQRAACLQPRWSGLPARGSSRPHTIHAAFDPAAAECLRALQHRALREFGPPSMPHYGKIIGPDVTGIERACYVELDADGTPRSADKTIPSEALPDVEPMWTIRLPIGDGIQKFTEDEEVRLGLWKMMRSMEAITARDA